MKINNDLIVSTSIFSWDEQWEISANLGENGYYMPFINNLNIKFAADNPTWIIEQLFKNLKILKKLRKNKIEINNKVKKALKFRKEELKDIFEEDYIIIIKLIKQAIKLGFFKEYYDKSK